MSNKNCILIGSDFWNKVGQDKNTFNELLEIFQKVGEKYSDKKRLSEIIVGEINIYLRNYIHSR